jgi:hypothetical protein
VALTRNTLPSRFDSRFISLAARASALPFAEESGSGGSFSGFSVDGGSVAAAADSFESGIGESENR